MKAMEMGLFQGMHMLLSEKVVGIASFAKWDRVDLKFY